MALEVVALFVIIEPLTGYVIEPLLYGHSTGLSPVSVIVSAIFWTWLWGPIGLIMSTPLTLCLVVMGRHVKSLEFFDVLLGDRPALTPIESFYQRILARNPDEALAQAEMLLTDRSLTEYYDGVVLEGLKLAVEDEARGTIDRAGAAQMTKSMMSVIEDLQPMSGPTPSDTMAKAQTVACVAGHGPFDDAVTAMLTQLLGQQGVHAKRIPNTAVSRDAVQTLNLTGIDVIAISYLEVTGSPAQLRYLVRRLRARAPNARIVVGLWPQGEASLSDAAIQQVLGAGPLCKLVRRGGHSDSRSEFIFEGSVIDFRRLRCQIACGYLYTPYGFAAHADRSQTHLTLSLLYGIILAAVTFSRASRMPSSSKSRATGKSLSLPIRRWRKIGCG